MELCGNGIDDDGNGTADENCEQCVAGSRRPCSGGTDGGSGGVGACHPGQQVCEVVGELTEWSSCTGEVLPTPEQCNGIDDDCDGEVDEGLSRACSTQCGSGQEMCQAGQWGSCSARQPVPEVCWNSVDDDCDGQVDDGCVCTRTPSRTGWQIHLGEGPTCWPQAFQRHGDPAEYQYATIPSEADPGWGPHAAPRISFDDRSAMCGAVGEPDLCTCRAGGDFTYFQTTLDVPPGYTVNSFVITVANVDDGVRATLFNSAHPRGTVDGYAYLGGGSMADFAPYVVEGHNRLVLTHVDDCCRIRRIEDASIVINGVNVNPCP